ncbi:hypothetical protein BJX65DRAFT_174701 [Aspergillus insuetus]
MRMRGRSLSRRRLRSVSRIPMYPLLGCCLVAGARGCQRRRGGRRRPRRRGLGQSGRGMEGLCRVGRFFRMRWRCLCFGGCLRPLPDFVSFVGGEG